MPKIYVITNPVPPHNNSPLISLGKFLRVIRHVGFEPTVIGARIPEDGIPGVDDAVPIINYSYGGRGIVKMASYLLLQIRTFFSGLIRFRRGDEAYFWIADKMIGSFLAAKVKGAETNFFLYGRIDAPHMPKWARDLIRYMAYHADFVCAEGASVFGECHIPEDKPLKVIRLFVPDSGITPAPYNDRAPIIAMMSRLSGEKHPLDSIRAFCRVRETMPHLRLRIIGGGPMEDECRSLVSELGAESFIEFTGWLPSEEAKKKLSECKLLLYPSDIEGVPGGILEAMSFGIPALASPVGGIPDLIEDGVDGVLLPSPDHGTIAAQLTVLLNSDRLEAMSVAAEKKIKEDFSLDSAAANFKAVRERYIRIR